MKDFSLHVICSDSLYGIYSRGSINEAKQEFLRGVRIFLPQAIRTDFAQNVTVGLHLQVNGISISRERRCYNLTVRAGFVLISFTAGFSSY